MDAWVFPKKALVFPKKTLSLHLRIYTFMSEYSAFNDEVLYPEIARRIDEVFPELDFTLCTDSKGRQVWRSKKHAESFAEGTHAKTEVSLDFPRNMNDWRRTSGSGRYGTGENVISVYARLHNMDWPAAAKDLTERLGLAGHHLYPKGREETPEEKAARARAERKQQDRISAQEAFVKNLWDDTAKPQERDIRRETLDFLTKRGWTEEHIRAAGLGLITQEMMSTLPDHAGDSLRKELERNPNIGSRHVLSIPYYAYGKICGFTFRRIDDSDPKAEKFMNTGGSKKPHLAGIKAGILHAVIVEGWFDHFAAKVRGINNVFAAAGKQPNDVMLDNAITRARVREFTLMLDNDMAGIAGTLRTIEYLRRRGIPCHVGRYTRGAKDLDEFFNAKGGTVDEFNKMVDNADTCHAFMIEGTIRLAVATIYRAVNGTKYEPLDIADADAAAFVKENATPRQREDLRNAIVNHLAATPASERREALRCVPFWADAFNLDAASLLEGSTGEEAEKRRKAEEEARAAQARRDTAFTAAMQNVAREARNGNVAKARTIAKEAMESAGDTASGDPLSLVIRGSLAKLRESAKQTPDGLPTGYVFKGKEGTDDEDKEYRLLLNPGLTFISAPTGHGKTSFLNNIIINVARRNWLQYQKELAAYEEAAGETGGENLKKPKVKSILYFSLEEEVNAIQRKLINLYCNDPDIAPNAPDRALLSWLRDEEKPDPKRIPRYFYKQLTLGDPDTAAEQYAQFCKKVEEFDALLTSGGLVFCATGKLETLRSVISAYLDKYDTALVCIDYAQRIVTEDTTAARYEQIKRIVNELATLAKTRQTPFLMASQFNRKAARNPLEMANSNAGEGGDIERIADVHIGLFNLKELKRVPKIGEHAVSAEDIQNLLAGAYGSEKLDKIKNWKHGEEIKDAIFATLLKSREGHNGLDTIFEFNGPTRKIALNDTAYCEEIDEDTPLPPATGDVRGAGHPRQAPPEPDLTSPEPDLTFPESDLPFPETRHAPLKPHDGKNWMEQWGYILYDNRNDND